MIPKKWFEQIECWQRSGLNQADYFRQQHLNYATALNANNSLALTATYSIHPVDVANWA